VDKFELEVFKDGSGQPWSVIYSGAKQSVKVNGLDPGGVYHFRVYAVNDAGPGSPSAETKITMPKLYHADESSIADQTNNNASSASYAASPPSESKKAAEPPPDQQKPGKQAPAKQAPAKQPTPAQPKTQHPPQKPAEAPPPAAKKQLSQKELQRQQQKAAEEKAAKKKASQQAAQRERVKKLEADLELAITKHSKNQVDQVLREAKKQNLVLNSEILERASAIIAESQAQAEREKTLHSLRQRLTEATNLDEANLRALVDDTNKFIAANPNAAKSIKAQIVEAERLLSVFNEAGDVRQQLLQAIKSKNEAKIEQLMILV